MNAFKSADKVRFGSTLNKAEALVAGLLTFAAIWLRFVAATSAGALWRDEANTVGLATLSSVHDVWNNLQFDSFPVLWPLLLREFGTLAGPMNDPAFRVLGFVVGVGVVAALWFFARRLGYSLPLVSLPLFAMNPSVIVWGDSARAYGLGILLIVVTGALLWRLVEQPTAARFALAALAALASVHTLFYNCVLLLAFCAGAAALCAQRRSWKTTWLAVGVGFIAAISIIPYAVVIQNARSWNMLVQLPQFTFLWFWSKLDETVRPAGPWALVVWAELVVLALVAGARAIRFPKQLGHSSAQRDVALFAVVTLVIGLPASFFFLRTLSYVTQPWYYLTMLAVSAVCVDAIAGSLIHSEKARKARLIGVVLLGATTFVAARPAVGTRMTNVDLIASQVKRLADRGDLIVVNPWFNGITFSRYYSGAASWMTLPPIDFHRYHRYDLIKQQMMMADQRIPLQPLESEIATALRSGHKVFVVGDLPLLPVGQVPTILPGAPLAGNTWPEDRYDWSWSLMTGSFLRQHSKRIDVLMRKAPAGVSHFENSALIVATGWVP